MKNDHEITSSMTKMLKELSWSDSANRQRNLHLVLFYKIINSHVAILTSNLLIPADSRTRVKHQHKFKHIAVQTPVLENSFFAKTIPDWDESNAELVEAPSVDTF